MKIKKILLITALVIAFVIIVLVLLNFLLKPDYNVNLTANIESEIKITRDGNSGIPVIEASTMNDVFFALGYVHTQDKMPVMEYYRMMANSSSAPLLGEDGLVIDRLVKIIGIRSTALKILDELTPKHADYLNSYVAGINRSKKIWEKFLPDEVIGRQWETCDIIAILLLREWSNAFLNNTELLFPISLSSDRGPVGFLIPPELQVFYSEDLSENIALLRKIKNIVKNRIGIFYHGFAFAIPADKRANAQVASAFSFQSQFSTYPGWYPVKIKCDNIQINAITLAGLPFILSGKSKNITFYGINFNLDTQDFIFHEVRLTDGFVSYMGNTGWRDFLTVSEPEFTQGSEKKHDTVYHTEAGPILNEIFEDNQYKRYIVSIKYLLPQASYISSLFELPLSENAAEAVSHTRGVASLPRAYLICQDEMQFVVLSGNFPIRPKSGNVISPRYFNWNGIMDLSNVILPAERYPIIGNNVIHLLPRALREYSSSSAKWLGRFEELVHENSVDSLKKILNDTYTPDCQKFLPIFIKNLESNPITSSRLSRIYLNKWDGHSEIDSVAATLFHSILFDYISETFADKTAFNPDDIMDNYQLLTDNFHKMILGRSPYFNDKRTDVYESPEDIFDRAFLKTLRKLSRSAGPIMDEWKWGNMHRNSYNFSLKTVFSGTLKSEWEKDSYLPGGIDSILNGHVGADLRPKYTSSMMGIFTSSVSEITMDFPCSLHPRTPFEEKNISFEFDQLERVDRMERKHITTIQKR